MTAIPTMPTPTSHSSLPIVGIETTAIRVPLKRVYRGSHYHMTHRSTVIVRVTVDGFVGGVRSTESGN